MPSLAVRLGLVILAASIASGSLAAPPASPTAGTTASPAPSPTSYKPLSIPTPGATPWGPLSLGGVTIADTSNAVRSRLGEPFFMNLKPAVQVWTYPLDVNHVSLSVFFRRGRVIGLTAALTGTAEKSLFVDPFGVHLGAGIDDLLSARGQPSKVIGTRNDFGAGPAFDWEYQFDHGIVESMSLNALISLPGALPNAVPATSRGDGSSLETPIRFKVKTRPLAEYYENVFLGNWCDGKGTWTSASHSMISDPNIGRLISVENVTCSTTQRNASIYFDYSGLAAH